MANDINYFNESLQQVRDSIENFVAHKITPFINNWEEACEFPKEIYTEAGRLGFLGIGYPEALGGTGEDDFF